MLTVREFLEMCTQDWIDVDLFNCDTEDCITIYIGDMDDEEYEEIMEANVESWDVGNEKICINYSTDY